MYNDEERIALFLDYENLAIGVEEQLKAGSLDFKPIADALAERGRVVVRRAYADWNRFEDDRRILTRHHVELIEIPQKMGSVRKNAADIKMAVDAIELSFEREYITTFVLGTGDSDFTPLVHKLRELNRRVIGIGVEASTSALLPPACDEFLFYERLEGVDLTQTAARKRSRSGRSRSRTSKPAGGEANPDADSDAEEPVAGREEPDLVVLITQTLAGLERSSNTAVRASQLKRALLRKDPTFSETTYGFRGFTELLRNLESRDVVELVSGAANGDPEVSFHSTGSGEQEAFELLRDVVTRRTSGGGTQHLSGLKNQLRKAEPEFSEKRYGYGGFLQFVKAAAARELIAMRWDPDEDDYVVGPAGG